MNVGLKGFFEIGACFNNIIQVMLMEKNTQAELIFCCKISPKWNIIVTLSIKGFIQTKNTNHFIQMGDKCQGAVIYIS